MKALKFLKEGAVGPYSGFQWPVPNGKPGKWVSAKGDLVACENGIHACTLEHSMQWLRSECYVIELGGRVSDEGHKLVARKGRLLYRTALDDRGLRLFAADCAEHVLHLFENERPNDDRPRKAIQAARDYANDKITAAAANSAAANSANSASAASAASAAASAASAASAAWSTAASAAAASAANSAARSAASAAERKWQTRRLKHYLKLPKGWNE